jgi:hypothetical protein
VTHPIVMVALLNRLPNCPLQGPVVQKKLCHYLGVIFILALNQLNLTEGFNAKIN